LRHESPALPYASDKDSFGAGWGSKGGREKFRLVGASHIGILLPRWHWRWEKRISQESTTDDEEKTGGGNIQGKMAESERWLHLYRKQAEGLRPIDHHRTQQILICGKTETREHVASVPPPLEGSLIRMDKTGRRLD